MTDNLEWQASAMIDIVETDLSLQEIADKYGRARDTIAKLKHRHRLTRKYAARKGPRRVTELKEISPQHRAVGIRLTMYRDQRNYAQVADQLGVSAKTLRYMELGIHDLTLAQLIRISEVLGQSINELTTPFQVGVSPPTARKSV